MDEQTTTGRAAAPGLSRRTAMRSGLALAAGLGLTVASAPASGALTLPALRLGEDGEAVQALQGYLARRGFWCGEADGYFGHLTQQAVWALQKAADIERDAVVGLGTLTALARQPLPTPQAASDGIEIDLTKQILMFVEGGQTTTVLNTSTGNGEEYDWYGTTYKANTPAGSFEVFRTYTEGWQSGPLGDLYRPQYFRGGIAVHGAPSIPPFPASHGCCRVSVPAMDMIWQTGVMQMGSKVDVVWT